MRVLHVSSSYPLSTHDSTAPFMDELAQAIARRGHEVRVVVPHVEGLVTGERGDVHVNSYRYAPRPLEVWGYGRSLGASGGVRPAAVAVAPAALIAMASRVRREIREWHPDLLHLHWMIPQGVVDLTVGPRIPVVVSLHGADAALVDRAGRFLSPLARAVLKRADHLVAASGGMLERVERFAPEVVARASIIPHGANGALFQPRSRMIARRDLGIDEDTPIVLGVGRLVAKKGFQNLISAVALIGWPEPHLYVAGDGPLRHALAASASANPDRVTLLGSISRDRLPIWYQAADVVAVPSVRTATDVDSGPIVLVEALASGRPVVSTPVGMAPDVIHDGVNGYLVSEPGAHALARAISAALENTAALGDSARRSFERLGDWDRVADRLDTVYRAASERRRQRAAGKR